MFLTELIIGISKKKNIIKTLPGLLCALLLLIPLYFTIVKSGSVPVHLELGEITVLDEKLIIKGKTNLPDGTWLDYGFLPSGFVNNTTVVKRSWQIEERRENAGEGTVTFWLEFVPLTQNLGGVITRMLFMRNMGGVAMP